MAQHAHLPSRAAAQLSFRVVPTEQGIRYPGKIYSLVTHPASPIYLRMIPRAVA